MLKHILVVDDDDRLRSLLKKYLTKNNFLVFEAKDAFDAKKLLNFIAVDFIVLDRMMPGKSGIEFAKELRKDSITYPVLMLTAMGETEDRIIGLESGIDDYLVKPFEPKELLLRINNILKRVKTEVVVSNDKNIVVLGDLVFYLDSQQLEQNGEVKYLTSSEARLLYLLASNKNEILSREQLINESGVIGEDRAIDVQINRLRKKIEPDAKQPKFLQTIRGQGYILKCY